MNTANFAKWREQNPVPDVEPWLSGRIGQRTSLASIAALLAGVAVSRPSLPGIVSLTVIVLGVPMMLRLADRVDSGPVSRVLGVLRLLSPAAALFALFSVMAGSGFFAGLLSLVWLAYGGTVAGFGILRLLSRSLGQRHTVGVDLAFGLIGIGAFLFTLAQFSGSTTILTATVIIGAAGAVGTMVIALAPPMMPENRRLGDLVASGALVAAVLHLLHPRLGILGSALLLGVAVSVSRRLLTGADAALGTSGRLMRLAAASLMVASVLAPLHLIVAEVDLRRFDLSLLAADQMVIGSRSLRYATIDSIAGLVVATLSSVYVIAALVGLSRTSPSAYAEARAFTFHAGPRTSPEMAELLNVCASQSAAEPLSLLTGDTPAGYHRSTWSVPVASFDNSCDAVLGWAGHEAAGVMLYPPQPHISPGETFAMAVPLGPITVTAAKRITDIVDEDDRYGFACTTLGHHLWEGSESILVTRDHDGTAVVTGTVLWRPTSIGAALSPHLTERLMGGIVLRCLEGLAAAETALVGDYLSSIVEDVSSRKMEVTRDALVQRTATPLIAAVEPEIDEAPSWDSGWDPVGTPTAAAALEIDDDGLPETRTIVTGADLDAETPAVPAPSVVFDPADLFAALGTEDDATTEMPIAVPREVSRESEGLSFDEVFSQPFDSPDLPATEFDHG